MSVFGYWLVVIICAIEVAISLKALNQRAIRFLVFFCIGLIYGLVPLIRPAYNVDGYIPSNAAMSMAPWVILAGTLCMATLWHVVDHFTFASKPEPLFRYARSDAFQRALRRITIVSAVIGVAGILLNFKFTAGSVSAFLNSSRFQYRASTDTAATLTLQLLVFAFVPPFMAWFLRRRWERIACLVYALALAGFEFIATSGDRSIPIGLLGALALGWLFGREARIWVSAVSIVAVLAAAFLSVGLYAVRKDIRHQPVTTTIADLFKSSTYRSAMTTDPLDYNGVFLTMIDVFPSQHHYLDGAAYLRILLFPVPNSASFGTKPPDTYVTIGNAIQPGSNLSLPPSIPGDGWVNFGGAPGTVLAMSFWGAVGAWVDALIRRRPWWAFFLGPELARMMSLFIRGQPYETVVLAVEMWLGMSIVARLCRLPPIWRVGRRVQVSRLTSSDRQLLARATSRRRVRLPTQRP